MASATDKPATTDSSTPARKLAYVPPVLTAYGTLARLTQAGDGSSTDAGVDARKAMACL